MPLTVSLAEFESATRLGVFHKKNQQWKDVLTAFGNCAGTGNAFLERALFEALITWRRLQPEDFGERNRKSLFLVDKVWSQLGILPAGKLDNLRQNAIEYTCTQGSTDHTRARASARDMQVSILEYAAETNDRVAVVVIDMESDNPACRQKYNGDTVLKNQVRVLQIARIRGLPVFEVNIVSKHGASSQGQTIHQLKSQIKHCKDVIPIKKPSHPTFLDTNFAEMLADRELDAAIVMGYDANQCVKATIFGSTIMPGAPRAAPGILDFCRVVTSRTILASSTAKLDLEYMLID